MKENYAFIFIYQVLCCESRNDSNQLLFMFARVDFYISLLLQVCRFTFDIHVLPYKRILPSCCPCIVRIEFPVLKNPVGVMDFSGMQSSLSVNVGYYLFPFQNFMVLQLREVVTNKLSYTPILTCIQTLRLYRLGDLHKCG